MGWLLDKRRPHYNSLMCESPRGHAKLMFSRGQGWRFGGPLRICVVCAALVFIGSGEASATRSSARYQAVTGKAALPIHTGGMWTHSHSLSWIALVVLAVPSCVTPLVEPIEGVAWPGQRPPHVDLPGENVLEAGEVLRIDEWSLLHSAVAPRSLALNLMLDGDKAIDLRGAKVSRMAFLVFSDTEVRWFGWSSKSPATSSAEDSTAARGCSGEPRVACPQQAKA